MKGMSFPLFSNKSDKKEAPKTLLQALGQEVSQLGVNLLISSGIVSESVLAKLKQLKANPETLKIISLLDQGEIDKAKEIAFDGGFISSHKEFLESGNLPRKAIEVGAYGFALEALQRGYKLNKSLMLNYIRDGKFEMVHILLVHGFLPGSLELELWYLLYLKQTELAAVLLEKQDLSDFVGNIDLRSAHSVQKFISDREVIFTVIGLALSRGEDILACLMINMNPTIINKSLVSLALKNTSIKFLKIVWTGNHRFKEVNLIKSRMRKSVLWDKLGEDVMDADERKRLARSLKISYILGHLLKMEKFHEAKEVLTWPGAVDEPGIIKTLIAYGEQHLASIAIAKSTGGISREDFEAAFNDHLYDLNVGMMKFKEALSFLESVSMQQDLIKLLSNGESCMQAMEMLSYIPNKSWHADNTKVLCTSLNRLAKKSSELLVCPSPILFCALTAEFASRLSSASLHHQNRCKAVAEVYIELGSALENAIKEEEILRYYLLQSDSRGRSVLSIVSRNGFYSMLENDEIESIVSKLWMGPLKHNGLLNASTLYYSFHSHPGTDDSYAFTRRMDTSKPYMFQCSQWLDSCSLRFLAQGVSTFIFLVNYNLLIYQAISVDTFMNVAADPTSLIYLRLSQMWVTGIMVEHLLTFIFSIKTKREYKVDNWRMLDIIMFITMLILMMSLHESLLGPGNLIEGIEPKLFNAFLHSVMMVIIWLRFFSVLITSKRVGPFIRMIYLMTMEVINFIVLFICLIACFSAVFTSLFNESSDNFETFTVSVRTLYSSAIGIFDFMAFNENEALGGILLGAYLLAAHVLLLNLLIALLANIYSQVITRVDTEHRAVVITYYDRWFWDSRYGILIFTPSPLTYLVSLASPLVLFKDKPKKYNTLLVKIFYICYAVPQFLIFLAVNFLYLPLLYIKGFSIYGYKKMNKGLNQKTTYEYRWHRSMLWIFIGLPVLIWALLRDSYHFWGTIYKEHNVVVESEKTKAQDVITDSSVKNIQLCLDGIMSPEVSVGQFLDLWMELEQNQSTDKKAIAMDFFLQFANSTKNPNIDVERIKRLLPKQSSYGEDYLERVQHIHMPWIGKGLKQYQVKVGALVIGGVSVPKELELYGGPLDSRHIESVHSSIDGLFNKHSEVASAIKNMNSQLEKQKGIVQAITKRFASKHK